VDSRRLPAAVLAAAGDRRGGAMEVAATALDGLLEVAADPPLLELAVAVLLAGQPAMAPIWHLASAAATPDPPSVLADLRRRLTADADAAVATATSWLLRHLADHPGTVATVSHSSLVARVLTRATSSVPAPGSAPRWGSVADPGAERSASSTGEPEDRAGAEGRGSSTGEPEGRAGSERAGSSTAPSVGLVGADAIGPEALLNAVGTLELATRVPTLVVATALKLVPGEVFERLGGPGFEVVPLGAVAALVVGAEELSPAEAGRRARELTPGRSG
jgi:hypothetical protein